MIQPAALPAVPGLLPPGEALPALAAAGKESPDFGALLAIETEVLPPPGAAAKLTEQPALSAPSLDPEVAILPQAGKSLPVALPLPARPAQTAQPASEPEPREQPEAAASEAPVSPEPAIVVALTAAPVPVPTPIVVSEAPAPALPRPASAAPLASQPAPAAPQPVAAAPAPPAPTPIVLSVIPLPTVPLPLVAETRLRPVVAAAAAVQAVEVPEALAAAPRVPPALPAVFTAERPRSPDRIAPAIAAVPGPPAIELPSSVTVPPAPLVQLQAAPTTFTPADPALRPHDFTQLVDRLVAARELAQPQGFQLALQHGEFGQVRLRFQREGEGLNVTMASADPDFARVVSAAPPPVVAVLPAETTGQGGPRADSHSQGASSNGQSAQSRGGSPERREDRSGPEGNPAAARQGEARRARRSGIFA